MRIGDLLVKAGIVGEQELEAALKQQKSAKKTPIGQLLKLLNFIKEDDLELVLQAQRKILFASMTDELALASLKYARQHKVAFELASRKVIEGLRSVQSSMPQAQAPEPAKTTDKTALSTSQRLARFSVSPEELVKQSDQAAAQQDWEKAVALLEQARTVHERSDEYSEESVIPVYCRLAAMYSKTGKQAKTQDVIARVAQLMERNSELAPGNITLLAAAALLCSRQGLAAEADQLYKLVMPRWSRLLPLEYAQFPACLKDAIHCSRKLRTAQRQNIRIGELLIEASLIKQEQFQEALQKSKRLRQPLGRVLSDSGFLSQKDLRHAVRVQLMCRAAALPAEYAAYTIRAASFAGANAAEFFQKLDLPLESPNDSHSLKELIAKMDSLLVLEASKGIQDLEVAKLAEEVADICLSRKENDDAEAMYRRAHAVFAVSGEEHQLRLASVCQKIGRLLIQQKKYPEAELLLLQAMEAKNRLLGDRDPQVAAALLDVGYLYFCQANYSPAIGFLRSAWMIQMDDASTEQKRYLLELLIKCFEQSGQSSESEIYREQLRDLRSRE
ncbi:MAG: tetratricopeptide repeat protein [Candidatus Obscuribacterales bacterium]|nr:tetratricopeptide repeat protein [Candidatus Obscuribacterales bacterium]